MKSLINKIANATAKVIAGLAIQATIGAVLVTVGGMAIPVAMLIGGAVALYTISGC